MPPAARQSQARDADEGYRKPIWGRVGLFLHTDDFARDYAAYQAKGITFCEPTPRHEDYGTVIVFQDKYGTKWDLVQPAETHQQAD